MKDRIHYVFNRIKNYLMCAENRKQNLLIIGVLLVMHLVLLTSFSSYAYYNNYSSFVLVHAKVGSEYMKNADYTLLVYLENSNNKGSYHIGESIPVMGYSYSGYKCNNNSILQYDEETKSAQVTTYEKDICAIYFDTTLNSDIDVIINIEDGYNTNSFKTFNNIPSYGYTFKNIECSNNGTGTYNSSLHYIDLNTTGRDSCNAYFNKNNTNNEINLFLESGYQTGDYINRNSFVKNTLYTLNTDKSVCKDSSGSIVEQNISYVDGEIIITLDNLVCDIYMDVVNET